MNLSSNQLLEALERRYATKQFDPNRIIPAETWADLEKSLVLTPSSFGLQPWKFLIVSHPETREKLHAASWGQSQVTDASHLVVFTARTDLSDADVSVWIERIAEVQGSPVEGLQPLRKVIDGFIAPMSPESLHAWNARQVYIALGQLMTGAAFIGLDTCPLEGIDPRAYDEILGLTGTGYATVVACAIGYRSEEDKYAKFPKIRFDAERVIERI